MVRARSCLAKRFIKCHTKLSPKALMRKGDPATPAINVTLFVQ